MSIPYTAPSGQRLVKAEHPPAPPIDTTPVRQFPLAGQQQVRPLADPNRNESKP